MRNPFKRRYGHPGDNRVEDLKERRAVQTELLRARNLSHETMIRIVRLRGAVDVLKMQAGADE